MINNEKVVAVIPARGGSKTVPGKNIRPLAGKPLIAWSIEIARQVKEIDRIIVSTDDPTISSISKAHGAEVYHRPAPLATDEALVIDALKDLIRTLEIEQEKPGWLVLLEPTCPLRTADDVRACLSCLVRGGFDSVATYKEADLNPHRAWRIEDGIPQVFIPGAIPWLPRQKLPKAYQLNGAVYVFRASLLARETESILVGKPCAVMMPKERSYDIDNNLDFTVVETLLQSKTL
jgi:N-acylneuraminate cytidylyltransferase